VSKIINDMPCLS